MEAGKPRIMVVSFSSEGAPRTWQTLLWERAGRGCTLQMEPSGGGRPVQGRTACVDGAEWGCRGAGSGACTEDEVAVNCSLTLSARRHHGFLLPRALLRSLLRAVPTVPCR